MPMWLSVAIGLGELGGRGELLDRIEATDMEQHCTTVPRELG